MIAKLPKISVIVPIYNVERYIERAIESVFAQTYSDLEIILINDQGTDASMEIARSICFKYNRDVLYIEHDKNRGLSAARNSGIKHATGEYLYFMDSDDELPSGAIALLVEEISAYGPADAIIGKTEEIGFPVNMLGDFTKEKVSTLNEKEAVFEAFAKGLLPIVAWNKMIKLALLREQNLYFKEGVVHEDLLWSFQLFSVVERLIVSEHVTYRYHANRQSITGTKSIRNFESYNVVLDELIPLILRTENKHTKIVGIRYFEFQKYAVIEDLMESPIGITSKRYFYNKIVKKRIIAWWRICQAKEIDFKVKMKSLIMFLPYAVAARLVKRK